MEVVYRSGVNTSLQIQFEVDINNAGPFDKSPEEIRVKMLFIKDFISKINEVRFEYTYKMKNTDHRNKDDTICLDWVTLHCN